MKWMKGLFLFAIVFLLAACGNNDTNGFEETDFLKFDKDNAILTLPKKFFEEQTEEEIREDADGEEIKEVEINDDGSVTYTLSKERHKEIVDDFKTEIDQAVEDIQNDEDYPSIKKIEMKNDYAAYDIYVDRTTFENSMDMLATITLYIGSSYYQGFSGYGDQIKVTLNYYDDATKELMQSVVLPDDLDEVEEGV